MPPNRSAIPKRAASHPRLWGWLMCGSAALTALGLALPWQNTTRGGRWFFSFPEGWIAAAATVIGFELAVNTLSEKWPLARRRRVAAISVLCSVIVLATVGFFAVKMLMNTDRSIGSGAGSLLMSVANLAWTFTAVKRHVQLREIERRQPKPAPAPPPDATPPTSE